MKNSHFDDMVSKAVGLVLEHLDDKSYLDQDGCQVVDLRCSVCGRVYTETLEQANALIVCTSPFRCLRCDGPEADKREFTLSGSFLGTLFLNNG